MRDLRRLLRAAATYLLGSALTRFAALLLLPLYTRYLAPAELGRYDVGVAYASLVSSALFLDIFSGVLRFMADEHGEADKARPVTCGGAIFVLSGAAFLPVMLLIAHVSGLAHPGLLYAYGLMVNLESFTGSVARGLNRRGAYIAGGLAGAVATMALNIVLLGRGMDSRALYLSACAGHALAAAIHLAAARPRFSRAGFDPALFVRMLRFSAPLCLNSLMYWVLTGYNRVAVEAALGPEVNGLLAVAAKFGGVILLLTQCFQLAWQELAFSKGNLAPQARAAFFRRAALLFALFGALALPASIVAVRLIFPYAVDPAYAAAWPIIPPYLAAMLLSAGSSFLAGIFASLKKTTPLFPTMALGALVNVVCIRLLIPSLGPVAAAAAMAAGFGVVVVGRAAWLATGTGERARTGERKGTLSP